MGLTVPARSREEEGDPGFMIFKTFSFLMLGLGILPVWERLD